MKLKLPLGYKKAINKIKALKENDRYLGAFVFGSVARGEITQESDLDVKVVVGEDNLCKNINHPFIDGIKLDISFLSLEQLKESTEQEIKKGDRIPMVAESLVVFDKTGELKKLRSFAKKVIAKKAVKGDYQNIQFVFYHADDVVKRLIKKNQEAACLSMGMAVCELLKKHYFIHGKWRVSDKRLFADLEMWDKELLEILRKFSMAHDAREKYLVWTKIIDYILKPLGGRQPIAQNNCTCKVCKRDLTLF